MKITVEIDGIEVSREYARNTVDWNDAIESMIDTIDKADEPF